MCHFNVEEKKIVHKNFEISGPQVVASGNPTSGGTSGGSGSGSGSGSGGTTSCQRDRECPSGKICNQTTHQCEVPARNNSECTVDSDCRDGKKCESNRCVMPPPPPPL